MKTSLKLLLPLSLILLSGCAEMVKKSYKPIRGGTVRYSTAWFMAEKNRSKAVEEMKAYCSPSRAVLLSENSQREFTGQSYTNYNDDRLSSSTTQSAENNVYLHFRCAKSTAKR